MSSRNSAAPSLAAPNPTQLRPSVYHIKTSTVENSNNLLPNNQLYPALRLDGYKNHRLSHPAHYWRSSAIPAHYWRTSAIPAHYWQSRYILHHGKATTVYTTPLQCHYSLHTTPLKCHYRLHSDAQVSGEASVPRGGLSRPVPCRPARSSRGLAPTPGIRGTPGGLLPAGVTHGPVCSRPGGGGPAAPLQRVRCRTVRPPRRPRLK